MKKSDLPAPRSKKQGYVVAMVLGGALSTLAAAPAVAAQAPPAQAVCDISRYCTACWRNAHLPPDSWSDCTQEVFCRLLERVMPDAWDQVLVDEREERRELIRAIDAVKKRTQRGRKLTSAGLDTVGDRNDPRARKRADEYEAIWQAARAVLSTRQQRILQLSLDGWSARDISKELRLSPDRVSDEKYKAICKLRSRLRRGESDSELKLDAAALAPA
jgi:RNA polymerase sigma factor (sigma-70 family)